MGLPHDASPAPELLPPCIATLRGGALSDHLFGFSDQR
jgi:hypothetical protein